MRKCLHKCGFNLLLLFIIYFLIHTYLNMQIKISNIDDIIVLLKSIMEHRIVQHKYKYVINTKLINRKKYL